MGQTVSESMEARLFDWVDYTVLLVTLILSAGIGLYFGKGGQKTIANYLFGDKKLTVIPVSMSLISSLISSSTLLGYTAEFYLHGSTIFFGIFPLMLASLIATYMIIPVLYPLQLVSLFEYLEMRFNRTIRMIVSSIYTIQWILHITIVIYGPALTLNQVTGLPMDVVLVVLSFVCILYTTVGGLKAVVYTDTFQTFVTLSSLLFVIGFGIIRAGGLGEMLQSAIEGDRLGWPNMDMNPTLRLSFWTITIGHGFMTFAYYSVNPSMYQRFLSVPVMKQAQRCALSFFVGIILTHILMLIIGIIMYAAFKGCDPLTAKIIKKPDQLLPFFVMELSAGKSIGFPGLFQAGILSASMSTMSTGLNTISGVIYKDFLEPLYTNKPNDQKANLIMKISVVIVGISCMFFVVIIDRLGSIVNATILFLGATTGISAAAFLLGIFVPCTNYKGVLTGMTSGMIIMIWLTFGSYHQLSKGAHNYSTKHLSTERCNNISQFTTSSDESQKDTATFPLYKISIFYFTIMGAMIVCSVAIVTSLITGEYKDNRPDPGLISPLVWRFTGRKTTSREYEAVELNNKEDC